MHCLGITVENYSNDVKIDGIEGESTDSKHSGWIEAINFSLVHFRKSLSRQAVPAAPLPNANIKPFTFVKQVDSSSLKRFQRLHRVNPF